MVNLNDFINFEKLWQDDELIQLKVVCSSPIITATEKIYVSDDIIDNLVFQMQCFLNGQVRESYWSSGEKGDSSTACVSFRFLHKDKLGHVLIETFMELEDGGKYSSHNCCFFLNTELGLLEHFKNELPFLKKAEIGFKTILNRIV